MTTPRRLETALSNVPPFSGRMRQLILNRFRKVGEPTDIGEQVVTMQEFECFASRDESDGETSV